MAGPVGNYILQGVFHEEQQQVIFRLFSSPQALTSHAAGLQFSVTAAKCCICVLSLSCTISAGGTLVRHACILACTCMYPKCICLWLGCLHPNCTGEGLKVQQGMLAQAPGVHHAAAQHSRPSTAAPSSCGCQATCSSMKKCPEMVARGADLA